MSKSKMLVVRVDESLLGLIKATATILERKESEVVRILLTRACKYWITRGGSGTDQDKIATIKYVGEQIKNDTIDEEEFRKLVELSKQLK